jgi:CDP-glycerol glycerophosphotransferase
LTVSPEPRVSVVVPMYNVERYLHECLESLAHQTARDIEVVMVDDGSTDATARIAAAFAETDPRFVLVQQANGGLGHARNTGVAHARGRYLAFVDSDDVVTENAYELLAGSLDRTGSDFATGNFLRMTTSGTRQAGMVFTSYYANRPRTHVRKHPALLYDRTAWNKLFRRTFWDQHGFRWPEGVLYEDIPVTLPAHVLARSVDVVRDPVYLWRERAGEAASITQRRTELRAIRDRFAAVDGVSRFLAAHGEHTLKRLYDKSVAEQDFRYFLTPLDVAGDDFRLEFLRLVNDFFDRADPGVFDDLPALQRLEWHLVRRRLLPELLEVVRFEKSGQASRLPWVRRGRRFYGDFPFRGDPRLAVPDDVYRLAKDELPLTARIEQVWWDGDVLRLSGYAFIALLAMPSERSSRVRLTLEESGHPASVVGLDVRSVHRPDVTEVTAPEGTNYDWSGWEASVPASALRQHDGFRAGNWRLRIELKAGRVTRREWLSVTDPGPARRPGWRFVDGARIVPTTPTGSFGVEVASQVARVESTRLDGPVVELSGTFDGPYNPDEAGLFAVRADGTSTKELALTSTSRADGGTTFVSRFDPSQLAAGLRDDEVADVGWELFLDPGGNAARLPLSASQDLVTPRVALDAGQLDAGQLEARLRVTTTGRLVVDRRRVGPEADELRTAGSSLEIAGRAPAPFGPATELVLRQSGLAGADVTAPMTWEGAHFDARLDVAPVDGGAAGLQLGEGQWDVWVRDAQARPGLMPVDVAAAALGSLPVHLRRAGRLLTMVDVNGRLTLFVAGEAGGPGPRSTPPARRSTPGPDTFVSSSPQPQRPALNPALRPAGGPPNGTGADAMIRMAERVVPRRVLRRVPPLWRARLVRAVTGAGRLVRR